MLFLVLQFPQSQKAALTAGMAEARYKAEIQPAGYAEVCTNIEGWILSSYNEGSYDEGTRINRYEQQTKINGLVCVNSKDKYALSLPVPQNDGSLATKCMDSSGFFDTGSIDTAFMSFKK